jgi:hypothetical protein
VGHWPIFHRCDLLFIHGNPIGRDHVHQIGDRLSTKGALGLLDEELLVQESLQHHAHMAKMFRPRSVVDQYVIEEYQHKAVKEGSEHIIHQGLECGRHIREPERYHQEFEETFMCTERRLLDIVQGHKDLVVAGPKI